jgi:hypothetical protein
MSSMITVALPVVFSRSTICTILNNTRCPHQFRIAEWLVKRKNGMVAHVVTHFGFGTHHLAAASVVAHIL